MINHVVATVCLTILMGLQSSSIIITVVSLGLATITLFGNELELIRNLNVSLISSNLSSIIYISNETLVTPAGNVTV